MGLSVDPEYPSRPYVYVLYTYDHILGSAAAAPRWGTAGVEADTCPNPPGFTADGCVVSGRLSRLTASGGVMTGAEHVLIEDWCQQFPSHSVGTVAFGPDGALYASAGEGASFSLGADYGQLGGTQPEGGPYPTPGNPCGDPPGGVGGEMILPTAEGGALRAQDIRTRGTGDPVGLSGTIIRIDPDTGAAWPANANAADDSANARRIIAYGLRNPFRFTFDAAGRLWVGDVGSGSWEEINLISDPSAAAHNFGWPCREGASATGTFVGLDLCTSLTASAAAAPEITWSHTAEVVSGDGCGGPGGTSSSISGLAFQAANSPFPAPYDGALFATDYSRNCIWAYPLGSNGRPDSPGPSLRGPPADGRHDGRCRPAADLAAGRPRLRRLRSRGDPPDPLVRSEPAAEGLFSATPTFGPLPLTIHFDASETTDPNDETLTYAWDLDGDSAYDDGTGVMISRTYTSAGPVSVGLRVTDELGLFDETSPPDEPWELAAITRHDGTRKRADVARRRCDQLQCDRIGRAGRHASAPRPSSWTFEMMHCPGGDCHAHVIQELNGTRTGSFNAPDHEYPSHLRFTVTVTDSGGMTSSGRATSSPSPARCRLRRAPAGIPLTLGGETGAPPAPYAAIAGSKVAVQAADETVIGEDRYAFDRGPTEWRPGP